MNTYLSQSFEPAAPVHLNSLLSWSYPVRLFSASFAVLFFGLITFAVAADGDLEQEFIAPPDASRPWVYWFFMDGNLTQEGMTADLEAMKKAGIGGAIYLEVGLGIPRGPVEFMSDPWQQLVGHAFSEADRLGLQMAIGSGPGWCGTGGPWIKPELAMQNIVASETKVSGPSSFDALLPQPPPRTPYFGVGSLTPELQKEWQNFYRDVVVLAFPTPNGQARIPDINEKALYVRDPYSSTPRVKPFLTASADLPTVPSDQCLDGSKIIDLTDKLSPDGHLVWDVPQGNWTIMRFGRTLTGQTTRPAPAPGLGFETDKFNKEAMDTHFSAYIETLLKSTGAPQHPGRGLTTLHFDSWEMGAQNWSGAFRDEFFHRRGYDPERFLPAMSGYVVDSAETTERFLWDLRQTAQELVVENQVLELRKLGRKHGLDLSLEPYDLNPTSDLKLGSVADVPMGEFWSKGWDFPTAYSCIEASSIGHTLGRQVIGAESFTAQPGEDWHQFPGRMKAQGDWAFCCGINRFVIHRYQAQPQLDRSPGMTMGPYGVHWERTQTWWDMVPAYHLYLSRCSEMLRRGLFVADILYLAPEGAPNVFRPPSSATVGSPPDRLGYNFDGCGPDALIERASVKDGRIVFPDGMSYRILVLPELNTMTPRLLQKIDELVEAGATVIGAPPEKSPSLSDYPACDQQVRELDAKLWGTEPLLAQRPVGKGLVIQDPAAAWSSPAKQDQSSTDTLSILHASYDADDGTGRKDVTDLVDQKVKDNHLSIVVNPDSLGGDPASGHVKQLHVSYTFNGEKHETAAPDFDTLTIPPDFNNLSPFRDIYPSYDTTAQILLQLGVQPDFQTDGDVRYIHRQDGSSNLYFVASRKAQPQKTICRFRVTGQQPEWWNPITGEHRDLPDFSEADGITSIPIRFDPYESGFVVFRKPAANPTGTGENFPELTTIATLPGPWTLVFDPKWGGPENIAFETLVDWTKRPEEGIKYYSGKAVYKTTFDVDSESNGKRCFLSLGVVNNMASVKLNGKDLGILWCDPWRIEIPPNLLQAHGNTLEVTVANLWINRLIRDSGLPEDQRLTSTTYNPYHPDSPLEPSGLLGPVTVQIMNSP